MDVIKTNLIVFGAGGHGRVVVDAAMAAGWSIRAWIDDCPTSREQFGISITAAREIAWDQFVANAFVVAVGKNRVRAEIYERLVKLGLTPATVVHPSAVVSRQAQIGAGTMAAAGVVVNPAAGIGVDCILNTGCIVDHDCWVEAHCHLCPGVRLAGTVAVGSGSMIGTGAVILPGIKIGERCVIGAGALVTKDVADGLVAYGNPARIVRQNSVTEL